MTSIVHIGKFYAPESGGIESVTVSLSEGAACAGHSISVVCFSRVDAAKEENIHGVKVLRSPMKHLITSQPLGLQYFLLCLSASKTADIVHLHIPNFLGALAAIFIPRTTNLLVHWHSDVVNKGLFGLLLRPLEFLLLRRADCVVATTAAYADASVVLKKFRSKVSVVPIGVKDVRLSDSLPKLPEVLENRILDRKIILAVGRLVPYKGFEVLIESAKFLPPNSVVLIVGSGPKHKELQGLIDSLGVGEQVLLTGRLNDDELHSLFRAATLFCLPSVSRAEAFGVVLLESMAYGLPIVASDISGSGVPWVNKHGVSGFNVPMKDAAALADACSKIINSEEVRKQLSQGSRHRFESEFNEEVAVSKFLKLYDRLLSLSQTKDGS